MEQISMHGVVCGRGSSKNTIVGHELLTSEALFLENGACSCFQCPVCKMLHTKNFSRLTYFKEEKKSIMYCQRKR